MPKRKAEFKKIDVRLADIPNMVDAVFFFYPDHDGDGWVDMEANPQGRARIDALFPRAHIEWREPAPGLPEDWRGFNINLPDVVANTETRLPLDIMPADYTIEDCTPEQLAILLALGVKRNGGRAAIVNYTREARVVIFRPGDN